MYFIIQQMVLGIHFHHNDERKILKHNFVCPSTADINFTAYYVFCLQFFLMYAVLRAQVKQNHLIGS